ncbi:MAG: hypothetical protein KC546_21285, partial [Anaerolineae bacterium]|nr:hypothetical protein [Anaerolineae bacterium]
WIGSFDLFNAAGERLDRSVYYTVEEGRDWIPSFTVPEDGIYPILVYGFDEVEYGIYGLQVRQLD